MSVLTYYTGGNVKQTRAAKAAALRDLDKKHEDTIRAAIKELGTIKVRALRDEKRKTIKAMRIEHRRMIDEVRARFDDAIAKLKAQADEKRGELRSSRSTRKANRERSKGRVTGAEKRQEIDEAVENDVRHWRPELVPIWRRIRVGFGNRPNMSRFEAFQQWVHDTGEETITAMLAEQAEFVTELDHACAEAKDLAQRGDTQAELWAVENCGRPVSAVSKRGKKSSAASRTASLYATGERPPEEGKKPKAAAKEKTKTRKGAKGQQSLSGGPLGRGFDDIPF